MPALIGPMIECLADAVERVTVVAHDPPDVARTQDEAADFIARPVRQNIDVLSLGPIGSWRDYFTRRRRVTKIVRNGSAAFDVVVMRLPNRRADTYFGGNRCARIVSVVLGYAPGVARVVPPGPRKVVQVTVTALTERTLRRILRASGFVVFNSAEVAEHYRQDVPEPVMEPWSMRRARYAYSSDDRLTRAPRRILICGRLTETKGVFEALETFRALRKGVLPDAELHVVGDGDARAELERRVAAVELGSVTTFHGWLSAGPELFSLFRDMDLMLHLSYAEGFPQVIWEALAHCVLVVCTPVGGLPHVLENRREVMYAPVRDVDATIRAIAELVNDGELRRRLIAHGSSLAAATSTEPIVANILQRVATRWPELNG